MSKLQELINELSPNSVKYEALEEYVRYDQPQKYIVKSTDYLDEYETPVLTPGQSFILGYTNETDGIYEANKNEPIILFDDFTTSKHWVDFDFKVKSSALKILVPKNDKEINFRYIYHVMMNINFDKGEHGRKWISKYSKIKVPIPPIEVQGEIVKILDNFTNLTAELTARKKQYQYYRNKILRFDDEVKYIKIKQICKIRRGRVISKTDLLKNSGRYPVYSSQTLNKGELGKIDTYDFNGEYVTWTTDGAYAGTVFYRNEKFSIPELFMNL